MPNDDGTLDGTTPGTTSTDGQPRATDWESSYKTMQRNYDKLKGDAEKQAAALQAQLADLNAKFTDAQGKAQQGTSEAETLRTQLSTLMSQVNELSAAKETATKGLTRAQLIISEFPELAQWEARGLLPSGADPDTTREILKTFKEALGATVGQGVKNTMAGAVPPGDGKTSTSTKSTTAPDETEEFVWGKLMETAGKDPVKFAEWQAKYDQIQSSKKPS